MQKGGGSHALVRVQDGAEGVFEDVVRVEIASLGHAAPERELGQDIIEHARFIEDFQPLVMSLAVAVFFVRAENGAQLRPYPFGRDVRDEGGVCRRTFDTLRRRGKAELSRLSCKPHEPKSVLSEYFSRIVDRFQPFLFDVRSAAERVEKFIGGDVVIDGVGGEVPPFRVEGNVVGEKDFGGNMGAAHVFVRTEAGVFVVDPVSFELDGTRVFVYRLRAQSAGFGGGDELLRAHGGANIPIACFPRESREKIAHASAHHVEGAGAASGQTEEFFGNDSLHRQNSSKIFFFYSIPNYKINCNYR